MPTTDSPTVNEVFFQPLEQAIATASGLWPCPEFPDEVWIRMGVQRVLEASESGRGFLQEHALRFEHAPDYANYFASLRSKRRRDLAREANLNLIALVGGKNRRPAGRDPGTGLLRVFRGGWALAQSGGA